MQCTSAKFCGACGSYLNNVATQFCTNRGKKECICARQSRNTTVTLLDKTAYKKEKERVSSFNNKQKTKKSKLKTSTPLTKPKKLVTISDCNWTETHSHLVCKQTLNHLANLAK